MAFPVISRRSQKEEKERINKNEIVYGCIMSRTQEALREIEGLRQELDSIDPSSTSMGEIIGSWNDVKTVMSDLRDKRILNEAEIEEANENLKLLGKKINEVKKGKIEPAKANKSKFKKYLLSLTEILESKVSIRIKSEELEEYRQN